MYTFVNSVDKLHPQFPSTNNKFAVCGPYLIAPPPDPCAQT